MDARTYTLKHPIEVKNRDGVVVETISSITMKRIQGRHARSIKASAVMPMLVEMIGCSAGLPPSTMDLMDFEDVLAAAEVGADFFGGSGLVERLSK
jgi:hypothetical protein